MTSLLGGISQVVEGPGSECSKYKEAVLNSFFKCFFVPYAQLTRGCVCSEFVFKNTEQFCFLLTKLCHSFWST